MKYYFNNQHKFTVLFDRKIPQTNSFSDTKSTCTSNTIIPCQRTGLHFAAIVLPREGNDWPLVSNLTSHLLNNSKQLAQSLTLLTFHVQRKMSAGNMMTRTANSNVQNSHRRKEMVWAYRVWAAVIKFPSSVALLQNNGSSSYVLCYMLTFLGLNC